MGVVATMAWGLGTIYTVKHAQTLNPYYSLGWQMLISGIILTAIAFFSGEFVALPNVPQTAWLAILYLVVVGSIITFAAFIYSLKRLPAAQASVYAYINPIVAVIIGAILNKEKLNAWIAVGTVITLIGVFLVNTGFRKVEKA
jgi:drug/metabolite transporter (DMT)-like permease